MRLTRLLPLACALAAPALLLAASPWDGTWKLDRAKSHLTGDSFTYSKLADGKWHVSFGNLGFDFAPDGKPYPVMDSDHTVIATMQGDHAMTFVNQFKGKTASTMKETLSADGATLTDVTSGTHPDGTSYTATEVSKHSGAGEGFLGKWVSTKETSSDKSLMTISTAADGAVTWTYPASKDSLTSRLDGTPSPVSGPQVMQGVVVTYKKASAHRLDYTVDFKGKKIAEGYDELAADGKTLSESSWAPGKMDEKTTSVYDKQ